MVKFTISASMYMYLLHLCIYMYHYAYINLFRGNHPFRKKGGSGHKHKQLLTLVAKFDHLLTRGVHPFKMEVNIEQSAL